MSKISNFTDLIVWQEGHKLVLFIYDKSKKFPDSEKYGITSQIQRASVSITSNIAEGFGRKGEKEKIQFYYIANGSLTEVKNLSIILRDIKLITEQDYNFMENQIETTSKLLFGLIRSIRNP